MTLENDGVPTCTVITEAFAFKTRREAEILEMGALPLVVMPHPVGQLPVDRMRALTDDSLDEIVFALTATADQLARRYVDRRRKEPFPPTDS